MLYGVGRLCVVCSCFTYSFRAYIFRCLVSCIFDVIHAEYTNILNLLHSHVEFCFVGLRLLTLI